jgi:predicted transcriptional regulator
MAEAPKDTARGLHDIAQRLDRLQQDLNELKTAWTQHVAEYGDLLKHTKTSADERIKLRAAVIEKTIGGAIWAAVVFLAIAVWSYIREHIK